MQEGSYSRPQLYIIVLLMILSLGVIIAACIKLDIFDFFYDYFAQFD